MTKNFLSSSRSDDAPFVAGRASCNGRTLCLQSTSAPGVSPQRSMTWLKTRSARTSSTRSVDGQNFDIASSDGARRGLHVVAWLLTRRSTNTETSTSAITVTPAGAGSWAERGGDPWREGLEVHGAAETRPGSVNLGSRDDAVRPGAAAAPNCGCGQGGRPMSVDGSTTLGLNCVPVVQTTHDFLLLI